MLPQDRGATCYRLKRGKATINWIGLKPLLRGGLTGWTSHHFFSLIKLLGKGIGEGDRVDASGTTNCQRCGKPNTSLFHKNYECTVLSTFRGALVSDELMEAAGNVSTSGDQQLIRNFSRGKLPDPNAFLPAGRSSKDAEIHWVNRPFDGVLRGHIFWDGSAYEGGTPAARAGWAI